MNFDPLLWWKFSTTSRFEQPNKNETRLQGALRFIVLCSCLYGFFTSDVFKWFHTELWGASLRLYHHHHHWHHYKAVFCFIWSYLTSFKVIAHLNKNPFLFRKSDFRIASDAHRGLTHKERILKSADTIRKANSHQSWQTSTRSSSLYAEQMLRASWKWHDS